MIPFKSFLVFRKVDEEAWINQQEQLLKSKYDKYDKKLDDIDREYQEKILNLERSLSSKMNEYQDSIRDCDLRIVNLKMDHEKNIEKLNDDFSRELSSLSNDHDNNLKKIKSEIEEHEEILRKTKKRIELENYDLEQVEKRISDKKSELEKKNKELSDQLRLIEAKASPDNVWLMAFQEGFSKAWSMMKPIMYDGFDKVKEEITTNAKLETIKNLQSQLKRE